MHETGQAHAELGTKFNLLLISPALGDSEGALAETRQMMDQKRKGAGILHLLLLFMAMISILDTQILAIFRRRKEIGLLMALGLTGRQIVGLFTLEGVMTGIMAAFLATMFGAPLLLWASSAGIPLPSTVEQFGWAASEAMYPSYSARLVLGTLLTVMIIVSFVSYWPARKIARLVPTEAIRGS